MRAGTALALLPREAAVDRRVLAAGIALAALAAAAILAFARTPSGGGGIAPDGGEAANAPSDDSPALETGRDTNPGPGLAVAAGLKSEPPCDPEHLVGRVVDAEGRPVARAPIRVAEAVRGDPPDLRKPEDARTQADGTFSFAPPMVSSVYRLLAGAPDVGFGASGQARPGRRVEVTLTKEPGFVGRVVDASGAGVADARVACLDAGEPAIVEFTATTGSDGSYRIESACGMDGPWPGFGRLEVRAPRRLPRRVRPWETMRGREPEWPPGTVADAVVDDGIVLRGQVVDEDTGEPVPGAHVVVRWLSARRNSLVETDMEDPFAPAAFAEARADEKGLFRIADLPVGGEAWNLLVTGEGWDPRERGVGAVHAAVVQETIALRRSTRSEPPAVAGPREDRVERRIAGRVLLPDGSPAVGARVSFDHQYSFPEPCDRRAFTDTDGRFAMDLFERDHGYERVLAELPGFAADALPFDRVREEGEMEFRLASVRRVAGTVHDPDDVPLAWTEVQAFPAATGTGVRTMTCRTDGKGRFEFRSLPAGPVMVRAVQRGGRRSGFRVLAEASAVTDSESQEPDLTLPKRPGYAPRPEPPTTSLLVTWDDSDASGALHARVHATAVNHEWKSVEGSPDGPNRMRFDGLVAGSHRLYVRGLGIARAVVPVKVLAPPAQTAVVVPLQAETVVRVHVVAPEGIDPEAVSFRIAAPEDGPFARWEFSPRWNADGTIAIGEVPVGSWPFEAHVLGEHDLVLAGRAVVEVAGPGETTLPLRFVRCGTVLVKVTSTAKIEPMEGRDDSISIAWPDGSVEFLGADGTAVRSARVIGFTTTGPREMFEDSSEPRKIYARLAPGAWVVRVTGEGGFREERVIQVRAGEETTIDVTLPAPP